MKPDWATRKAQALFTKWWSSKRPTGDVVTLLAKALRAERRHTRRAKEA